MQHTIVLSIIIAALFASPLTAVSHGDHKHAGDVKSGNIYTCPMHPEVQSDKPGKCPKCGMTLVLADKQPSAPSNANTSYAATAAKAKQLIGKIKEGPDYNCCIKHPCDRCALDHQSCDCTEDVKSGAGVCSDCYAGWQQGQGAVPDMDAKKVKLGFHKH